MSRSRRKVPLLPNAAAESDRDWKRDNNGRMRAAERAALATDSDVPQMRELSSVYYSAKDGYQWVDGPRGLRK